MLLFTVLISQRLSRYGKSKPADDGADAYRLRFGTRSVSDAEVKRAPLRAPYGILLGTWSCVLTLARRITEDDLCLRLSNPGMMEENRLRTDGGSCWGETGVSFGLSVRNICSDGADGFREESRFTIDDAMRCSSLYKIGEQGSSSFSIPTMSLWFSFARLPSCWHSTVL